MKTIIKVMCISLLSSSIALAQAKPIKVSVTNTTSEPIELLVQYTQKEVEKQMGKEPQAFQQELPEIEISPEFTQEQAIAYFEMFANTVTIDPHKTITVKIDANTIPEAPAQPVSSIAYRKVGQTAWKQVFGKDLQKGDKPNSYQLFIYA